MTINNPFSFKQRVRFAESIFTLLNQDHPDIETELHAIIDFWDNTQRKSYIQKELPEFDTIITGNPIVEEVRSDKQLFKPKITSLPYRWTHIRHQIQNEDRKTLKQSVPDAVLNDLQVIDAPRILQSINKLQPQLPKLAADIITTYQWKIVLIKRKFAPYGLALAWWMLEGDEQLHQTALREWLEELFPHDDLEKSLTIWNTQPFFTLDKPKRDPRWRIISCVYEATITWWTPQASDDAKDIVYIDPADLNAIPDEDFAFIDHKEVLLHWISKQIQIK